MAEENEVTTVSGEGEGGGSDNGAASWRNDLPEDFRDDPSLVTVPDVPTLAKSYLEQRKVIGRKGIIPPKDDDPDEKWAEFYGALGRPEKPQEYKIERPALPEGLNYSEEFEQNFLEQAHKLGLNQKQAKGLFDWYLPLSLRGLEEQNRQAVEAETTLKSEWGSEYDNNLRVARLAFQKFANKDDLEALLESGAGNDPRLVRLFFKVGKAMAEDTLVSPSRPAASSLDSQIESIEKNPALFDPRHPEHKSLVKERDLLYKKKYPEKDKP